MVTLSNGQLVSALYRIQVMSFMKRGVDGGNLYAGKRGAAAREVGTHPPHGSVSLPTVRLPCLRKFLVFPQVYRKRRKDAEQTRKEQERKGSGPV